MNENFKCSTIESCIKENLIIYFNELDGQNPTGVYDMVFNQCEKAVVEFVLQRCNGNQTQTAKMLGISRNSLRNRIEKYAILIN